MTCRNNLTPKVTVVVSTPDSGKHRCRKQLPRVKVFNSTAEPAESYVLGETGTSLPILDMYDRLIVGYSNGHAACYLPIYLSIVVGICSETQLDKVSCLLFRYSGPIFDGWQVCTSDTSGCSLSSCLGTACSGTSTGMSAGLVVWHLAAGQHPWGGPHTKTSRPRIGQLDMT